MVLSGSGIGSPFLLSLDHDRRRVAPERMTEPSNRRVRRDLNVTHIFVWLRGYLGGGGGVFRGRARG